MVILIEIFRWVSFLIAVILFERIAENILYPKIRKFFSFTKDRIALLSRENSLKRAIKIVQNYRKAVIYTKNTSLFVAYCHSRQSMHTARACMLVVVFLGSLTSHIELIRSNYYLLFYVMTIYIVISVGSMIAVNLQSKDVQAAILYPELFHSETHKRIVRLLGFHGDNIWIGKTAESWLDPDRHFDPSLEKAYVLKASARER